MVATSIIPLLAFALAYQYLQYRRAVAETGDQTLALARSMAYLVDERLHGYVTALEVLADSTVLRNGNFGAFRQRAVMVIAEQFPGATILLIGRDGRELLNTRRPPDASLPVRGNMETTQRVFATGKPAVSNLFHAALDGRAVVEIDVPAFAANGNLAYVLVINPNFDDFASILRDQNLPPSRIESVFDGNGVNVARIPDGERFLGVKTMPGLLSALAAQPEGIIENTSREGVPLLAAFSHVGQYGWTVAVGVPRSELTRPALVAALDTLAAGGGMFLVGLALAVYVARQIARPIDSLRHLGLAVASEHSGIIDPVVTGLPEVDEVAEAFHAADRARRRSQDSEAVLRDSINIMPEGLAVYDDQDRLVICNESYKHLFPNHPDRVVPGARFEDMLRSGVAHGYYTGPPGRAEEWIADRTREHRNPGATIEQRLADGRWILVNNQRLPNGWIAGLRVDITGRKQIEHQLVQAQKMEAIGNLTGGMAHDFNNLLGIVIGNLDLARSRVADDEGLFEIIDDAHNAAWRGADLTRRLLAFARRQPLRPERVNVNELISNTVRLLGRLLGEDIEVSLQLADNIWPVTADPAQLEAGLANLATNARDAMPKGGRLIIVTDNRRLDADYVASHLDVAEGDYVMIEVSDTGTGMSPETVERIFEPFFTTKEPGKGSGLGLSMVFGFLRQSGGHINVYSELGAGTTFRLYLPRTTAEKAASKSISLAPPMAKGAGETILVVEDNPAVRRVVLRQLSALGYRTFESADAREALDLLGREQVNLLFSDIVMPGGIDGVELARIAAERWPALKIVLTSGFPQARLDSGDTLKSLRLLSKPYSQGELAAMLRASLDS